MGKTLLKEMSRRVINNESQVNRNKTEFRTFASQHILTIHVSSLMIRYRPLPLKINKFSYAGRLCACLLTRDITECGIGNKNFVQIKMYVTYHKSMRITAHSSDS